jgi:acyl-CoA synthetase (AMP-forming)/AMP-acid ligase II
MVSASTSRPQNEVLVHHFLEQSALESPEKTAVVHDDRRVTYTEINAQANRLARWLVENGVKKGDRVVLFLENSLTYIVGYYGTLKAGAVTVPLSVDLKAASLEAIMAEIDPKLIISARRLEREIGLVDPRLLSRLKLLIRDPQTTWGPSMQAFAWDDVTGGGSSGNPEVSLSAEDLASIIYTSGSTGKPKGVMLSHGNIVSNSHSICSYLRIGADDIQMVVLPFHYVMGKSLLNSHFAVGATVILNNRFALPASVVKQLVDESVTAFSGVPSTFAYLLHRSPLKKYREKLTALRYCSQAGGHMAAQVKRELRETLPPHTEIFIMYGATEATSRLAYLEPAMFEAKMGSIGKAIPGVTLKILDKTGSELPDGQVGELVVSGSNIMQGYWRDPEATAAVLTAHGYHTGDFGYRDPDGFFFVTGRRDEMLKVGGYRVSLLEIEEVVLSTGQFVEAVVLGLPDPLMGNRLALLVVPKGDTCNEHELLAMCAHQLPKFKLPGEIKQVRSLPKNSSGKIDRQKCLELLTSSGSAT